MPTLKDVAQKAGVNPSTVSRVISDNPRISQQTKDKVIKAMQELKYRPNAIARSLASSSKTKMIGIILASNNEDLFHNPFFIQVISSISNYAQDHGYYILHGHSNEEKKEIDILKDLVRSNWVDGIILTTIREEDGCVEYLQDVNMPFVVIGRPKDPKSMLWVDNDNFDAMYDATLQLVEKGYRKIAYVGGSSEFTVNNKRHGGYKKALVDSGLEYDENYVFVKDDSEVCGADGARKILDYDIPDAVVTSDDLIAFGFCQVSFEKLGYYVPIVGFNNTPISLYRDPAFSTVDIFAKRLGYYATKILIDELEGVDTTMKSFVVKTQLIERQL